jgi:hypothetical protein
LQGDGEGGGIAVGHQAAGGGGADDFAAAGVVQPRGVYSYSGRPDLQGVSRARAVRPAGSQATAITSLAAEI